MRTAAGLALVLGQDERSLLADLLDQLLRLVEPADGGPADTADPLERLVGISDARRPDDSAMLRLFPDAYRDDTEAADEFRRFTELELRGHKAAKASSARRCLDRAEADLTADEADAWLIALNDLRLAVGTRAGVAEDDDPGDYVELAEDNPRRQAWLIYDWLTWLQSSLLAALRSEPE